ncbi:hypothetical protein M409DRAFT_69310 [Zasmidium cellare ATCC 36951]|uniref:GYF domain-containing protein n=1 Tax=Zasmidium cellare ATCC 36951 TaxID=1080233 RepID=A0A6A6C8W2_ZASCE|nr:uncharacterized protein M409DRAFT_69310 [Zasmidium cellare ATCC 36951]KAF2162079.1 hypothetical protein M409DRAFT_69310 [Zasmidium cellare ATCC 36951]
MAPSSFASAAAGNNSSQIPPRDAPSEWPRRTNGATQTFRRPSGATNTSSTPHQTEPLASLPPRYVPPHRNGTLPDTRYAKEQLLDLYKTQQSTEGGLSDGLQGSFVGGWQPDVTNGTAPAWGRADQARDPQPGPEACWEKDGSIEPLGLTDMDDDERELFMNSVNTPIKPPATNKDNQQANGLPGRKVSISTATTPGGFGLPSPNVARGGGRRRETSESYPFPQNTVASPGGFNRDEQRAASPPPSLQRRRTDLKDANRSDEKEGEEKASTPFGTLKRHPTGPLSAGFNAPSSPWGSTAPQSAGLSPMGSFGNFGLGGTAAQAGAASDKRPGLGSGRSESRFKNLLSKDSGEEIGQRTLERKTSISSLSRVNENESWRAQDRTDPVNDILDEADEDMPSGSAALNADTDISPPHPRQGLRGFGTPSRQGTQDEFGFGAFGMTSDNTHGFGQGFLPGREAFQQTPAHQRMGQPPGTGNEPMSPTDTNPYQSPEQHGVDRMHEDAGDDANESHNNHLPGLGQFGDQQLGGLGGLGALPNLGRAPGGQGPASDRSQTSSVGPNRGFSGLGGLGQLGNVSGSAAWPVTQGGLGTPSRQTAGLSNAFGGGVFSNNMSDLQSPSLAGLGGGNFGPQAGFGGSRMASMFPQAMQDQMRQSENDRDNERAPLGFGGFGDAGRAAESPFANQGFNQGHEQSQAGDNQQAQFGAPGQPMQQDPSQPQGQFQGSSASSQPPAPQQRTMVMPDRMRWIYKDPQGQTQGPWTGLEMHDWYKAGFFSPELLVKKYEDLEYEPLAQLIRRIGNSREPFLVPQIGIPHGAATAPTGPNAWASITAISTTGAQPPFASSFPSFGTTLTAEQQNALERRKQEEQYLMARQKEHLAQAQIAQRMQMQPGHPNLAPGQQLQHHSSAQSLHSQPSFGSIASPTAFQPSPVQGPTPASHTQGFFDNSFRAQQAGGLGAVGGGLDSLGRIREEEIPGIMDRLNLSENRGQFGAPGQPVGGQQQQAQPTQEAHDKQVQQMLQDRARLQQEQAEHDVQQQSSEQQQAQASNDRLQQFQQLQNEIPGIGRFQPALERASGAQPGHQAGQAQSQGNSSMQSSVGSPIVPAQEQRPQAQEEPLSLTEQVQKAASAKQSPVPQQPGLPQPFPPAPSQSPLPAPAAQRTGRQSVADQLQTESRDLSQTPSADTRSATVAPWAKEPAEAPKGPSLKEIQAAEAKKAAEAEAMAAAARRAQLQKDMEAQQVQASAPQPGLPTSSTWGAASPATPTGSAPAAWTKTAQKPTGPSASKTLAQIQKEEEARKKKQAAAAAAAQAQAHAMSSVPAPAGGKSYANLAGKVGSPAPTGNAPGGAWTTVGAGGKPKTPAAVPTPAGSRTVSAGVVPTLQPAAPARKPPTRSSTMTNPGTVNAQEEFKKWAIGELRPDLNKEINADEFVAGLVFLPPDAEIITEAVHGVSSTIDSRHFANEFIRRKKLADKGLIDTTVPKSASPGASANGQSGWNEVAKKGPSKDTAAAKEEANGNFRVVAAKKKGQSKR